MSLVCKLGFKDTARQRDALSSVTIKYGILSRYTLNIQPGRSVSRQWEVIFSDHRWHILKKFGHRHTLKLHMCCAVHYLMVHPLSLSTASFHLQEKSSWNGVKRKAVAVLPTWNLMPRAERLVPHLAKHNISIAVGRSSSLDSMKLKTMQHLPFMSLFNHLLNGSEEPEVKKENRLRTPSLCVRSDFLHL